MPDFSIDRVEDTMHPVETGCTFCEQFSSPIHRKHIVEELGPDFSREIYSDDHFVVVAALGQLIEGWLLVIPRNHFASISSLPRGLQDQFMTLINRVLTALQPHYGETVIFEHGSVTQRGRSGACIEHAHMHIVPRVFDIIPQLSLYFELTTVSGLSALWKNPLHDDYLYFQSSPGSAYLTMPRCSLPCQFFRRLIAAATNRRDKWDWRTDYGIETIVRVTSLLRGNVR